MVNSNQGSSGEVFSGQWSGVSGSGQGSGVRSVVSCLACISFTPRCAGLTNIEPLTGLGLIVLLSRGLYPYTSKSLNKSAIQCTIYPVYNHSS